MTLIDKKITRARIGQPASKDHDLTYFLNYNRTTKHILFEEFHGTSDDRDEIKSSYEIDEAKHKGAPAFVIAEADKYAGIMASVEAWCVMPHDMDGGNPCGFHFNEVRDMPIEKYSRLCRELGPELLIKILKIAGDEFWTKALAHLNARSAMYIEEETDNLPFPSLEEAKATILMVLERAISPDIDGGIL